MGRVRRSLIRISCSWGWRRASSRSGARGDPPPEKPVPAERKPPQRNRGALPAHLPRVEIIVDVEDKRCPCCGGAMHVIGEDVAEVLDVVPRPIWAQGIRRRG